MNPTRSFRATTMLAILMLAGLEQRSSAAGQWNRVDSAHFSVVGDIEHGRLKSLASGLEQFRLATSLLFPGLKVAGERPLTIVIIQSDQESFGLGDTTNVGGYFNNDIDRDFIVMMALPVGDVGLQVILHEYEHAILDATFGRLPRWAHEGLASFYETFREGRNGKYEVGRPGVYAGAFRTVPPIALEKFLSEDGATLDMRDAYGAQLFYAESWSLVHFFTFGDDGKWRPAFGPLLKSVSAGMDPVDTLRRTLGGDFDTFKTHFVTYARGRVFPFALVRFDSDQETGPVDRGTLSVAETAYLQGRLMTNRKKARKVVAEALEAEPENRQLLEVRASQLLDDRQAGEAAAILTKLSGKDGADSNTCTKTILALNLLGKPKEALAICTPAPSDLLGAFERAVALEMDGRTPDALALMPRFKNPPRWFENALSQDEWRYLAEGRFVGARRASAIIIANSQEADEVAYARFVRWAAGCLEQHCDEAREALKRDPPPELSEWTQKVQQFITGELTSADFAKRAKTREQQTEAHTYIAIDFLGRGQRQKAFEELVWVVTNGSDAVTEFRVSQALYYQLGGR